MYSPGDANDCSARTVMGSPLLRVNETFLKHLSRLQPRARSLGPLPRAHPIRSTTEATGPHASMQTPLLIWISCRSIMRNRIIAISTSAPASESEYN